QQQPVALRLFAPPEARNRCRPPRGSWARRGRAQSRAHRVLMEQAARELEGGRVERMLDGLEPRPLGLARVPSPRTHPMTQRGAVAAQAIADARGVGPQVRRELEADQILREAAGEVEMRGGRKPCAQLSETDPHRAGQERVGTVLVEED